MKLDERGLYPIYDVWHIPFWQTKTFAFIVASISISIIACITWCLIKYKKNKPIIILPWEQALKTFEQLQYRPCHTRQDGKEIYSLLIHELKNYCSDRYQYICATKTDNEFLLSIQNKLPVEAIEILEDIIQGGILVKFANEQTIQEQLKRHIAYAIKVIRITMPQQSS